MASTYSDLKIQLMATGENLSTWGDTTNTNLATAVSEAITGSADVTFASANLTLTLTNVNTSQTARNLRLNLIGVTGGSTRTLTVPAIEKVYIVNNTCADSVTVQNATGTGITVPAGRTMWVFNDATNVVSVVTYLASLSLGSALPVASGGTGITSLGTGVATWLGTPSSANLAAAITDETGSGSLVFATSPVLTTPNIGTPSFATLTNATGLPLGSVTGLGTNVATFLATPSSANLAAAITNETGSGLLVFGTSPVLTTPNIGVPSFATLTNATGLPLSTGITGTLSVANGGTGQTTYTDGQILIGNTTGNTLTKATITAGSGVAVTSGAGSITISATGSGGSVTSVNASGGSTGLTFSGGPVTTIGTLTMAGTLAVANGGTGQTTYTNGQLLIGNTTGNTLTKATLTAGTGVTITNGTGTITISSTSTGGTVTSIDVSGGTTGLTTSGGPVTGSGTITLAGTLAVTNGGTGVTTSTGSGANALATSPTLVTPLLGTPTSGTLTNCTGLPIASGVSGLGTNVATFLATPTSANLAAAITNETGSGLLVFGTSPVLTTPNIGVPSFATLTNATGLPVASGISGLGTNVATFLATPTSATLADAITNETGSGLLVFATSPTLVTPLLGTPTSGTLTNCTGLPLTTGVTGTLPVANGGTGVTTSTGSGNVVLSTSPVLTTPNIGVPSFATLTNATGLPLTTGVTGTLPVANGGTNLTGFTAANNAIYSTSASVLVAGTLPVAAGGTGVTTSTGSGNNVLSTSPVLTTPNIGVPSFATLTNATGLPVASGISGLGTNVATFLATPSSANLAAAITDETGSGLLVFGTSPVLTTPNIGVPSFGTLTNCTGLPATTGLSGIGGATCTVSGSTLTVGRAWGIVSTVVRTGTGIYRVDFTSALADTNYTVVATGGGSYNRVIGEATATEGSRSTSSFYLISQQGNATASAGSLSESARFNVVVYA